MANKKTDNDENRNMEPGAENAPEYRNQVNPQGEDQEGEAERREANEKAGRTQDQQQEAAAKRAREAQGSVQEGDRVTVLTGTPEGHPVTGTVRVLQDEAGKKVGVELDDYTLYGHSLDGRVDEREQGADQPVVGRGWWTTEEDVQKLDA